jgi:hypothetical protein
LVNRRELVLVHEPGDLLRSIDAAADDGVVNDALGRNVGQVAVAPDVDSLQHRCEAPLGAVDADGDDFPHQDKSELSAGT